MPRKKSLVVKATIGIGKGIGKGLWLLTKGTAQAAWWTAKKTSQGISHLVTKAQAKDQEQQAHRHASTQPPVFSQIIPAQTVKGTFDAFQNRLHKESLIILIAGRRGSGKSVTGFRLLENAHAQTKRPCYAIGPNQAALPSWIQAIDAVDHAQNGGLILVDEGALAFSSRESMSNTNRSLGQLLAIARHKDLTLILITQNTGMIDKNVLNLCDSIVFKEGSLLQERMERSAIKDLYATANKALESISFDQRHKHCYVIDSCFEGLCAVELPSFWTTTISKNQA